MKQDPSRPSVPPVTREGAPEQPAEVAGATPSAERRALRVLLVEDLVRVQNLLRELIDEPGRFEVAGLVETEADAILRYTELQPDAVVIDLNLRSGTGLGVIMALRRLQHPVRPLLIVLTNHALPVLETACLNAGADYFLDKSRDFQKVRTLLENAWSNIGAAPHTRSGALNEPPHGSLTH
jgi:two-component system, OmpR family, response regulator